MNAVGIDVSKGKSMVASLRPMGEVALLPQESLHTGVGLEQMAYAILALGGGYPRRHIPTGKVHFPMCHPLIFIFYLFPFQKAIPHKQTA